MEINENDQKALQAIEKELGIKLGKLRTIGNKLDISDDGYILNQNGQVIGLSLYNCGIENLTHIIAFLKDLKNLTGLNLWENQIQDISALKNLRNLTELYLIDNQVKDIDALNDLINLTELDLIGNQVQDISALENLKNLTCLWLEGNKIQDISVPKNLRSLTELYLGCNKIREISGLKDLRNLTYLDLSDNKISELTALKELSNLTSLNLSKNQISELSALKDLRNLTFLNLSDNQISDLSLLKSLKKLQYLYLTKNPLEKLSGWITDFDMDIHWADKHSDNLNQIEGIVFYDNPLKNPPVEIVKQGKEAIRNYFKSLEKEEKQPLNEVKMILVGDGGAGKTSLVKQLLGEKFDPHECQTHGINIRDWYISKEENTFKINTWDFGGQEIMHATHQFFLSKRCLYVLVLDGRKDEKTEYWLKHIESFGGNSPILVVINKIDENSSFDVNRLELQEKYKGIKGFHKICCQDRRGIAEFAQELESELLKVELIQSIISKKWFAVKTELEKMAEIKEKHYIDYDEYEKMCISAQVIEESQQKTLVDLLHDLGVILHFDEFQLQNIHVLEPRWVTEAVYKIINSAKLAESKGLLNLNDLGDILIQSGENDYFYPRDKYFYIIELMKKFELCYSVNDSTVLIPDLLEVQKPEFQFNEENCLRFRIDYGFLPRSVMPRFIVKMHKDIKDKIRWRTGVVLENQRFNAIAEVKSDNEEKQITIKVNGIQKKDYFSVILHTLRDINDSFEKLSFTEKVPMPDNPDITVSYEHLIRLALNNHTTYFPDGSDKEYNVGQLLGEIYVGGKKEINDKIQVFIEKIIKFDSSGTIQHANITLGDENKQVISD